MQYKQSLAVLFILTAPFLSVAQTTTYLPQGSREAVLLERLEIKAGTDSILNFSKTKPYSRRQFIPEIERYYLGSGGLVNGASVNLSPAQAETITAAHLTNVDLFNARLALQKNNEFSTLDFTGKHPFLNTFYETPANAYEVRTNDFFLAINPVVQFVVGKEKNSSEHIFQNSRGLSLRGMIANKIGFTAFAADNQERDPTYVQDFVSLRQAVPGVGYYKEFKGSGYDYFDARGTITLNAAKFIDVSFGFDKNFIGNGYRSLFLSDFANNALFLRLNTRIWKINYQNLFMELVNAHGRGDDKLLDKKYAAIHHLDVDVAKWLNIGLFEGVIFNRPNHFEFSYLNPIIFYRSAEQQNGSADNAMVGFDAKANVAHHLQLYGQLLLDEFKLKELGSSWWANKYGIQVGGKYIDAFGVPNLDLQAELNRVRPFTYSHYDSAANYTHDNLPLAHPLGANFNEVIGIVRYQPIPRLYLEAKAITYKQGRDTGVGNYGSNIFLPNSMPYRLTEYGFELGGAVSSRVNYSSFLVSYEWKPNFFLEASAVMRKQSAYANVPERSTSVFYAGFRWNMHRRNYEF